jgi:hypothetical protein
MLSPHAWITIGILSALPLILGLVLYFWGEEKHDNGYVHQSGEDKDSTGDDEGAALAARRAA